MSDFYNIGLWLAKKMEYHQNSSFKKVKRKQVNLGEVWRCDLGYNVGEEKNKIRPVVVISNNRINRTGKVIVAPITDAKGKINLNHLPQHNSWYLLYSNTTDPLNMYNPNRRVPNVALTYGFLTKDSVVQCEEMRSLSKARLLSQEGKLDVLDVDKIKHKIKSVFDI